MAYGQGYAGDPRGREAAVEARQGRDDFSFEDKRANAQRSGGYYEIERDLGRVWRPGASGPEESYSATSTVAPVNKPAPTKIEFYLDETPALVEQKASPVTESAGSSAPSYSSSTPISSSSIVSPAAVVSGSTLLNPAWNYLGAQGKPMTAAQKAAAQKLAQTSTLGQALKQDAPYKYDKSYTGAAKKGLLSMLGTGGTPATRKAFEAYARLVGPQIAKWGGPLGAAYGTFDTTYNLTKGLLSITGLDDKLYEWGSSLAPIKVDE